MYKWAPDQSKPMNQVEERVRFTAMSPHNPRKVIQISSQGVLVSDHDPPVHVTKARQIPAVEGALG